MCRSGRFGWNLDAPKPTVYNAVPGGCMTGLSPLWLKGIHIAQGCREKYSCEYFSRPLLRRHSAMSEQYVTTGTEWKTRAAFAQPRMFTFYTILPTYIKDYSRGQPNPAPSDPPIGEYAPPSGIIRPALSWLDRVCTLLPSSEWP